MIRFVDLCAGIGGFHLAAKAALRSDAQFIGGAENDAVAAAVYDQAFRTPSSVHADLTRANTGENDEWALPQFDICFAGFPCQSFSNVGKRLGFSDVRSWVFHDIVRVIQYYSPRAFVLENVEKLRTIEKGAVLAQVVRTLERAGYWVDVFTLSADRYGLPQQRKRLFFCGRRRSSQRRWAMHPPKPRPLESARFPTAWHVLERVMPPEHIVPLGSRRTIFTRNAKWMGDLEIDRAIARPLCATMGKWHRANQDNYYTEHFVLSRAGEKPKRFNYRTDAVRRLTPLEALRLQGFPDRFADHIAAQNLPVTVQYRLIGNAVPVSMAAAVIRQLVREL